MITVIIGAALGTTALALTAITHNAARAYAVRHATLCAYYAAVSMSALAEPGAPRRGTVQRFSFTLGNDRVTGSVDLPPGRHCRIVAQAQCRGATARTTRPVPDAEWCGTS